MGKKSVKKREKNKSVQQQSVATKQPSVEELLVALEEELKKPSPALPLLDLLDSDRENLAPSPIKPQPRHIAEPPRDGGLGVAEKQMIGRMWHQLADKLADEEEKS